MIADSGMIRISAVAEAVVGFVELLSEESL
jgi:hypothetical protein